MTDDERKAVDAELEALKREGRLTPEAVLERARDPQNPLHALFEWDDAQAAEKYYVSLASGKHDEPAN